MGVARWKYCTSFFFGQKDPIAIENFLALFFREEINYFSLCNATTYAYQGNGQGGECICTCIFCPVAYGGSPQQLFFPEFSIGEG